MEFLCTTKGERYNIVSLDDGSKEFYFNAKIDSTTIPHSLLLETARDKKGIFFCSFPFFQREKSPLSEIKIDIHYKTENAMELYLKIVNFGECEKVNSTDTLQLPKSKEWSALSRSVNMMEPLFLNLCIEAKGNKDSNAKIWVDKLDISIDGKNINKLESTNDADILKVFWEKEDAVPFTKGNFTKVIPDKKILAIGETIHGTETMNETAIEIIKERVTDKKCTLVLLEIPLENSFYINRYIDGDLNFTIDSIASYFERTLFSQSFVSLIQWIKDYNHKFHKKVYVYIN